MKKELLGVLRAMVSIQVDVNAGSKYLVETIVKPKLQIFVDKSSTPLDNIVVSTLMPELEKQLSEASDKANNYLNGKIKGFLGYDS